MGFLVAFIFQVSVIHAVRNFCQYDHMAFSPFVPSNMRRPVPKEKGQCATERIFLMRCQQLRTQDLLLASLAFSRRILTVMISWVALVLIGSTIRTCRLPRMNTVERCRKQAP